MNSERIKAIGNIQSVGYNSIGYSVPTVGDFTGKLNAFWLEMRTAVKEAVRVYGYETINKIVEGRRSIILNGNEVEFQGTAGDIATEVDAIFAELRNISGWQYYEVDFFRHMPENGKRPDPNHADADYSMLIKAWHKPTVEEAEEWLKDTISEYHEAGVLQVVGPVTEREVAGCYDMDHHILWPIHGKKGEVSAPPTPAERERTEEKPAEPEEMSDEVAEKNGVVAAMCCLHCSHFRCDSPQKGVCKHLNCKTFTTDVCKHYHGTNED